MWRRGQLRLCGSGFSPTAGEETTADAVRLLWAPPGSGVDVEGDDVGADAEGVVGLQGGPLDGLSPDQRLPARGQVVEHEPGALEPGAGMSRGHRAVARVQPEGAPWARPDVDGFRGQANGGPGAGAGDDGKPAGRDGRFGPVRRSALQRDAVTRAARHGGRRAPPAY